jgi:hypothetical protein
MSAQDKKGDGQGARSSWQTAQRELHDRNEAARQAAKKRRSEADRREAAGRRERDARNDVYR